MDLTQLVLNGAGGAIIGPLVAHFLGGRNAGMVQKIIAGIVGGVGAGAGADAAGMGALLGSGEVMQMAQAFLEGGLGGGVLSTIAGAAMKRK